MVSIDPKTNNKGEDVPQLQNEDDADAILASLEDEDDSLYRAQRIKELGDVAGASVTTTTLEIAKHAYPTLKSDDETLSFTTEHERAVVHFFHPEFARCSTMDSHCELIAEKHADHGIADVSIARVNVKDAPFVVEKLGVRVLPCVLGFVKGVVKGRITGFEGLCWDGKEGSFEVARALEETFVDWTVLRRRLLLRHEDEASDEDDDAPDHRKATRGGIRGPAQETEDDGDDWD